MSDMAIGAADGQRSGNAASSDAERAGGSMPVLKRILGSLLFGAPEAVSVSELRSVLSKVAERDGIGPASSEQEISAALGQLNSELGAMESGLAVSQVAGGFRLVTDPACGPWVRALLNLDKPARLSRPALETLAIIAFRQPVTRPEIEAVRGVNVDSIMRNLLEMQLIRIIGKSDLPGRPVLYGTTQLFLEHFGLNDLKGLPSVDELRRREKKRAERQAAPENPDAEQGVGKEDDSGHGAEAEAASPCEKQGCAGEGGIPG